MIRKIVLLMLVFVLSTQGASATTGTIYNYWDDLGDNYGIGSYVSFCVINENGALPQQYWYQVRMVTMGGTESKGFGIAGNTSNGTVYCGGGISDYTQYFETAKPKCGTNAACNTNNPTLIYLTASTEASNIASGESCTGIGSYTYYVDGVEAYTDSIDGNYSFNIFDGIDYQINYADGNISEWHNFTASGDDTWQTCTDDYIFSNFNILYNKLWPGDQSLITVDITHDLVPITDATVTIEGTDYAMNYGGGNEWWYIWTAPQIPPCDRCYKAVTQKRFRVENVYAGVFS